MDSRPGASANDAISAARSNDGSENDCFACRYRGPIFIGRMFASGRLQPLHQHSRSDAIVKKLAGQHRWTTCHSCDRRKVQFTHVESSPNSSQDTCPCCQCGGPAWLWTAGAFVPADRACGGPARHPARNTHPQQRLRHSPGACRCCINPALTQLRQSPVDGRQSSLT